MTDAELAKWQLYIRERLVVDPATGCWNWQLGVNGQGYGCCTLNKRGYKAHRLSYEVFVGPIPEGLVCRHQCHNAKCCNPAHLLLGTQQDNMDDAKRDGRSHLFVTNGRYLSPEERLEVQKLLDAGELSQSAIADQFGVGRTAILNIVKAGRPH